MSRGVSYGGGQSSLGYLFGSDQDQPSNQPNPPSQTFISIPPYGTDTTTENPNSNSQSSQDKKVSNSYPRAQGQNSGNFITDRPSTKVNSVPGGDSSLGYLFADNNYK